MSTKRFYVTLTWDDWPEGGSYGDIVEAKDEAEAELKVRIQMAQSREEEQFLYDDADDDDDIPEPTELELIALAASYSDDWHVVDCFDLDEFIERHKRT